MKNQGKYIYSIIKESSPRKFDIPGMQGRPVYTMNHKGWGAVVSDSPTDDFLITREYTMSHQRVLEEVMREGYDILPVSFGTVASNREDIKTKILELKREEFEKALALIGGKMELNLKVLWKDISSVFKEIAESNPTIKRAKQISGKNFLGRFQAAQLGEIVKKELDRKREKLADKILSCLTPMAADTREGEILQDAMVLNSTFLLPKSYGRTYDKTVLKLAGTYGDKMNFMNYGPLPPYNFVSIRIELNN